MKKRLLLMCPNPNDATSFWRGAGPFSHLNKTRTSEEWDMTLYKSKEVGWSDLIGFDLVFVQRPHSEAHVKMMRLAKDLDLKIWVDYDDDLTVLPFANPANKYYTDADVQKNLSWIAANADVISVSTEALEKKYQILNKNVVIVPNAWNEIVAPSRLKNTSESKIIMWRGSNTHDQDMDHYLPQMKEIASAHPDWKWVFIGQPYWKVVNSIPRHMVIPPFDVPRFLKFIGELAPSIVMVPLAPNEFNQSKSNIAWQEGSFAGALSIVPDWSEWKRPGALSYSTQGDFCEALKEAIAMTPHERKEASDESWFHIKQFESLEQVNAKRAEILRELAG